MTAIMLILMILTGQPAEAHTVYMPLAAADVQYVYGLPGYPGGER